jgi:hypothetical protein
MKVRVENTHSPPTTLDINIHKPLNSIIMDKKTRDALLNDLADELQEFARDTKHSPLTFGGRTSITTGEEGVCTAAVPREMYRKPNQNISDNEWNAKTRDEREAEGILTKYLMLSISGKELSVSAIFRGFYISQDEWKAVGCEISDEDYQNRYIATTCVKPDWMVTDLKTKILTHKIKVLGVKTKYQVNLPSGGHYETTVAAIRILD